MCKNNRNRRVMQAKSVELEHHLYRFLGEMLWGLNEQIDRRLVGTFMGLVMAIMMHRHQNHGLFLSELGATCWALYTIYCTARNGKRSRSIGTYSSECKNCRRKVNSR